MRKLATLLAASALAAAAWNAAAAGGVRVSLASAAPVLTAGRAWTAKLTVRPVSFQGTVHLLASGSKRLDVRASGGRGSYRARLVFPTAGRWTLTARAGGTTSRLGAVTCARRRRARSPSPGRPRCDVEPGGSLLVVENGLRRLVRLSPSGRVTELASLSKPYAVRRADSGAVYVSDGPVLRRIDGTGTPEVAEGRRRHRPARDRSERRRLLHHRDEALEARRRQGHARTARRGHDLLVPARADDRR